MVFQTLTLFFWLFIIPFCAGLPLTRRFYKAEQSLPMILVTGYFVMLSVFQTIYLFFIVFYNHFEVLVVVFEICMIAIAVVALASNGKYFIFNRRVKEKRKFSTFLLWGIALLLIGFQCYMAVVYQFHDGDAADYTVTSVITNTSNNMYVNLPYTGGTSAIDKRHAFSSAPIFLSFLARVSGMHPTAVTYSVFPIVVLLLFYMSVALVAELLLEKDKAYVPLFLIFIALMNVFGNDTIYTSSTFLLTRTSQGKAFMAAIIPCAALLGLLLVWKNLKVSETKKGNNAAAWVFLSLVMITAGYTSILGICLVVILIGLATLTLAAVYKKLSLLVPCMLSILPLFVFGLLYLKVLLGR